MDFCETDKMAGIMNHTPISLSNTYYNIDSDSSDYSDYDDDDSDDGDVTEEDLTEMTPEEINDAKYLAIFQNNSEDFDEQIMSTENFNQLKKLEQSMMDRTDKGYYRCKIQHEGFYNECMTAMAKYITPQMLSMLQHEFSTQKNESLNHSVATLAPKGKDYSKSSSLKTRVMLTAGAQIKGHYLLWQQLFRKFLVPMDENLIRHLQVKDQFKWKRQLQQKTKEYKACRSSNRYSKFAEAHRSQLEDAKTGAQYESGIAVKNAKKTLKDAPKRNPPGTLLSEWKCKFNNENYCINKGHRDARSVDCWGNGKTKEEKDAAVAMIMKEAISNAVDTNASESKYLFRR